MKKNIPELKIYSTLGYINNFATSECKTSGEISFDNDSGMITVENNPVDNNPVDNNRVDPRSEHQFIINNATILGLKYNHNSKKEINRAAEIFLISCSLHMGRYYLFSTKMSHHLNKVEYVTDTREEKVSDAQIPIKEIFITMNLSAEVECCLLDKIKIDEKAVFETVKKLLSLNIFDSQNRSLKDSNLIQAIKSYQDALNAIDYLPCYKLLYPALEKAVNLDTNLSNDKFDIAASRLTGMSQNKIKEMREFNNRLKHSARKNTTDLKTQTDGETKKQSLLLDLKGATDKAILAKL